MTTISSITGDACIAAMVCSMIGLPAILISCLGMFSPTRVPVPPARTTATLRKVDIAARLSVPRCAVGQPAGSAGLECRAALTVLSLQDRGTKSWARPRPREEPPSIGAGSATAGWRVGSAQSSVDLSSGGSSGSCSGDRGGTSSRSAWSVIWCGYQNPVINVQSILARHELVRELDGEHAFDAPDGRRAQVVPPRRHRDPAQRRQHDLPRETSDEDLPRRSSSPASPGQKAYRARSWADDQPYSPTRWSDGPRRRASDAAAHLAVIEAACGSANDYRFFRSSTASPSGSGLHRRSTSLGANVGNCSHDVPRSRLPGRRRRRTSRPPTAAYDWAVAHDLLEHLSPRVPSTAPSMSSAGSAGAGSSISFFADGATHAGAPWCTPRRYYHVNTLSRARIHERFAEHCSDIKWIHTRTYLADRTGFERYYSAKTWTIIARHGDQDR